MVICPLLWAERLGLFESNAAERTVASLSKAAGGETGRLSYQRWAWSAGLQRGTREGGGVKR